MPLLGFLGLLPMVGTALSVGKSLFGKKGGGDKRSATTEDEFFQSAQRFKSFNEDAIRGYGALAGEDFAKQVGSTLGGLNQVGALRSGAVSSELGNLTDRYARTIGQYALQAAPQSMEQALGFQTGVKQFEDEAARSRKAGFLSTVGGLLGKGIGVAGKFAKPESTIGKILAGLGG